VFQVVDQRQQAVPEPTVFDDPEHAPKFGEVLTAVVTRG